MLGERSTAFFQSQGARVQAAIQRESEFGSAGSRGLVRQGRGALAVAGAKTDMSAWAKSTKRAVGYIHKLRTDAAVRVDPSIIQVAMEWIAAAAPPLLVAIEQHFIPLAEHVHAQWPVATGASKDAMALTVRKQGDDPVIRFEGLADYTFFVFYSPSPKYKGPKRRALSEFEQRVLGAIKARKLQGWSEDAAITWAAEAFKPASRNSGSELNAYNAVERIRGIVARARGDQAIEKKRTVYRLPDGGDARSQPAWRRQAVDPFRPTVEAMYKTVEAELQRAVDALSRRAA